MSMNEVPDSSFYDVVDRFVVLANDQPPEIPRSRISATLMYAAARYNAFNWLQANPAAAEWDIEDAVMYYREQYEIMLRENIKALLSAPE